MSDLSFFWSPTAIVSMLTTLLLIVVELLIVLRDTVFAKHTLPRSARFLPLLAFVLMVGQIAANIAFNMAFVLMSTPLYLATLLIVGGALVRGSISVVSWARKRNLPATAARFSLPRAILAVLCAALVLLGVLRITQTYVYAASMVSWITLLEGAPSGADFSMRSWEQGFAGLIGTLKVQYPFTAWKRIDWDALDAEFAPRIAEAEARHDTKAYYRVVREFAWRISDGHVGLEGDDQGLAQAEIGGSYGLTLLRLDDGRLVVRALIADGPAAQAGIRIGAQVVAWNGATVA